MSPTNPLLKDGPMTQPSPHEPSMEEIPASIRRIIAGDQALPTEPLLAVETKVRPAPARELGSKASPLGSGRGASPLSGLTREMLRPMLKTWLDDNLPGIVERLVSAEFERVALGDFTAIEAGLLGSARHESEENLSKSEELDGCEEAEGAEHWRYEDTSEGSSEARPPFEEIRPRRPLYLMAAMIVAGIAGIGASFGFKGAVSPQDEIATISAANGPAKIHPETAAGTVIPQDASILGGSPQQPPVAVVNNVEQPADLTAPANLPEAQATPPRAIVGLATGAASVPVPAPPAQAQPQPSAEPLNIADLIEPKKVKTVLVRPDGTLLPNDAPPQVTAAAVPVLAARPIATYIAKALTPKSAARVATKPRPAPLDANGNPRPRTSVAAKAKRMELTDARKQAPATAAPQASPGSF
jgi:Protein of unknown function (DUF2497)